MCVYSEFVCCSWRWWWCAATGAHQSERARFGANFGARSMAVRQRPWLNEMVRTSYSARKRKMGD